MAAHDTAEPLTLGTPDSSQTTGTSLMQYVGQKYRHSGNNKLYAVVGVVWDSPTDLWAMQYREVGADAATVVRDHITFFGERQGVPRFFTVP